ncbi:hypothetical protein ASF27_10720 [Methylobacterium sp. Leaf102]|uniref:helix-turn-helix transcriptional regulator n=1 Tax=Methylobacterium sp. Leaf102 TaxID=1736253 RepID=UPI0006FFFA9A|nr:helix-turn-helix domain-containing protein [Methylobacterium sp. Leaf102]KQP24564.1 hypothetical protein ASF27_10720 [Methylobacterium sp. Leaf102]
MSAQPSAIRKSQSTLLTTEEVAERLDIPAKTVAAWRSQLRGPSYIRLGPGKRATIRYRPEAIDEFIAEMERQTNRR